MASIHKKVGECIVQKLGGGLIVYLNENAE